MLTTLDVPLAANGPLKWRIMVSKVMKVGASACFLLLWLAHQVSRISNVGLVMKDLEMCRHSAIRVSGQIGGRSSFRSWQGSS